MSDGDDISVHDNASIINEYENRDLEDDVEANNEDARDDEGEREDAVGGRRIDPSVKRKRSTLQVLNVERLRAPKKGIHTIEKYFEGFKFHGKGHEKEDLDRVMKRLEHWAHRLFPKYHFDDFLAKTEKLGSKKELQVFVKKYRLDMITSNYDETRPDTVNDSDNDENEQGMAQNDEFDAFLDEQIEKTRHVPTPSHSAEAAFDRLLGQESDTTINSVQNSQPIATTSAFIMSEEAKQRAEKNRQEALRRRAAKLAALSQERNSTPSIPDQETSQSTETVEKQVENSQSAETGIKEKVDTPINEKEESESAVKEENALIQSQSLSEKRDNEVELSEGPKSSQMEGIPQPTG